MKLLLFGKNLGLVFYYVIFAILLCLFEVTKWMLPVALLGVMGYVIFSSPIIYSVIGFGVFILLIMIMIAADLTWGKDDG